MTDDRVQRVAREIYHHWPDCKRGATAAIAVCMEEAAKVCDEYSASEMKFFNEEGGLAALGRANAAEDLAAAIRALVKEPQL